jgi:hypothetical protein
LSTREFLIVAGLSVLRDAQLDRFTQVDRDSGIAALMNTGMDPWPKLMFVRQLVSSPLTVSWPAPGPVQLFVAQASATEPYPVG